MHTGWCVWITGLPGSGKSVISEALMNLLDEKDITAQVLSSDALRRVLTPKPSYSLDERDVVYATLVYAAELLTENGVNLVIDATGNLRRYRDSARKGIQRFLEVYLKCPLAVCVDREKRRGKAFNAPRRIYAKALEGKASAVPGMGQPYEPPLKPELTLDTTECQPKECAQKVLEAILSRFYDK